MPTRRSLLLGCAATLAVPAAGCVPTLTGSLAEPVEDRAASRLSDERLLYAVTNRRRADGQGGIHFGGERGQLDAVAVVFRAPPQGLLAGATQAVQGKWVIETVREVGSANPLAHLAQRASGQDVFIYIHGYNETFAASITNAAQLADGVRFRGVTTAFTWPSKGGLLDYNYDRESALYSRDALAQYLGLLLDSPTVGRIHIVAHSMGGMLTLETLRQLAAQRGGDALAGRLGAIVFAAPDIDTDVFTAGVRQLGPLAARMTLITAVNDRALAVSSRLAGGVARAGAAERSVLEGLGVRVADASNYGGGLIRHDLFLSDEEVRSVVRRAIDRGRAI